MPIREYIKNNYSENVIFVLKGYSVEELGYPKIDIAKIITPTDKLNRLNEITGNKIKAISFEEFILLGNFLTTLYNKIYILDNQIYINFYPVGIYVNSDISSSLLSHFDDDASDTSIINEIDVYTEIYANYKQIGKNIGCVFNLDPIILENAKVEIISLNKTATLSSAVSNEGNMLYRTISEEEDYFAFVREGTKTDKTYIVDISQYCNTDDNEDNATLMQHLSYLAYTMDKRIYLYKPLNKPSVKKCNSEVYKLMKELWGFDHFRILKNYDFEKAQDQIKQVVEISQENIVYDIISEVEESVVKNDLSSVRDIFVTAPTGSGKSLMFQLPAIYLAKKYKLLTIVITPLIALMKDQIDNLEKRGYKRAATVNSDIAPIIKQEIYQNVMDGEIDILYLSPESLLSRSDIEQLIGKRDIGLFVVDEAHIVTTWGKQFRPDYWFLGDYIDKIRKKQMRRENGRPFIISTFTATAIYGGIEDMYRETINSLHMINPISYLGYVKRENISIEIKQVEVKKAKTEYEKDKFDSIIKAVEPYLLRNKKVLIYFPLIGLIERCYEYFKINQIDCFATKYYGSMSSDDKNESINNFRSGKKLIMLATKAFGMGIDIPDIYAVIHFAPTGNVCDYVQEIGRAARDASIQGHAIYQHMSNDFKHINRLHGMSAISKWQLTEVISKILDLYSKIRYSADDTSRITKKRNAILVDVNSFGYIFDSIDHRDENDLMAKVKTAMLLIQKDYEKKGFSPFVMRPSPLFSDGFFSMDDTTAHLLAVRYKNSVKLLNSNKNIYRINLQNIWEKEYKDNYSFPEFKYLIYSKDEKINFNKDYKINSALQIEIEKNNVDFYPMFNCLKEILSAKIITGEFCKKDDLITQLISKKQLSRYKAENIITVLIATINRYQSEFSSRMNSKIYDKRESNSDTKISESFRFKNSIYDFFLWVEHVYKFICENTVNNEMYSAGQDKYNSKEIIVVLGLLEAMDVLKFKALGGENSQLYIYVNETKTMEIVKKNPEGYKNKLLELVGQRHEKSVKMMSFLFQHNLSSDQIWDYLENYFLGIMPAEMQ